jgi:hypothetical protein
MKKTLSAIFLFGWMRMARAQGAPQAILQQIAALKGYIATAEEGTNIVGKGLSGIRDIKNFEFNMHRSFFHSLQTVNPKIQYMPQVLQMVARQESVIDQLNKAMARWQASPWLHVSELALARNSYNKLVEIAVQNVALLHDLTTYQDYKMTDGERLEFIQRSLLIIKVLDQGISQFINAFDRLTFDRQENSKSIDLVKDWYKLPKI